MPRIISIFFILSLNACCCRAAAETSPNLTHPDPESVVQEVQRRIHHSVSTRRKLLSITERDSSCLTGNPIFPSCLTGNPIDDCWRSQWPLNPQLLADCGIGFGKDANGGKGGAIYTVIDSSDDDAVNPKPGTLRHAVIQEEPLWINFSWSMTITLKQELILNSHKTIDGRGVNVQIADGACITIQFVSNVIIHGLHIHGCKPTGNAYVRSSPTHYGWRTMADGDGISIFGSTHIWIDHCTLSNCRDGLIDAIMGSTAITISNNHFHDHNEVMLFGHSDDYPADAGMQVTVAFNRFGERLTQRMPRCRFGYFHIVNNDYTEWEMYAIGGSAGPTVWSQGNQYTAPNNQEAKEVTKRITTSNTEGAEWNWLTENDRMLNGAYFVPSGSGAGPSYQELATWKPVAGDAVSQLTENAGVIDNLLSSQGSAGYVGGDGYHYNGMVFSGHAPPAPIRVLLMTTVVALIPLNFLMTSLTASIPGEDFALVEVEPAKRRRRTRLPRPLLWIGSPVTAPTFDDGRLPSNALESLIVNRPSAGVPFSDVKWHPYSSPSTAVPEVASHLSRKRDGPYRKAGIMTA